MSSHKRQPSAGSLDKLRAGNIEIIGRLPRSSNYTFLVDIKDGDGTTRAVYKPEQGEQDLWDFPPEIYKREVAAFLLSDALGWPNIPPTVMRNDAPFGVGSLQLFMSADFEQHYFTLFEDEKHDAELIRIAVFDVIANNADRKAGHVLHGDDGGIYAIDNGLCFHVEPKLRTVVWEYQNKDVPQELLADIERVSKNLPPRITELLHDAEIASLKQRARDLLADPVLPELLTQRQYPWPMI